MTQINPFVPVVDNPPRNQYTAAGSQTAFNYTFLLFSADDLVVVETDSSGTDTTRTQGAGADQWTITGVNAENGGTITFNSARTNGNIITLYRDMGLERSTFLALGGGYNPEKINLELSSLLLMLQQVDDKFSRIIQADIEDTDATLDLPRVADRASMYLAFDASGNLIASAGTGSSTPISSAMTPVVQSSTLAAARTAMGVAKSGANTDITSLSSPALGAPTMTTQSASDNSTKGASTAMVQAAIAAAVGSGLGFRNRIINGGMLIDQRNSGSSHTITTTGAFTLDRYTAYTAGANATGQRNAYATGKAMYRLTGAASVTAINVQQIIESYNVADLASTTVTLSVKLANSLLTTVNYSVFYPTAQDNYAGTTAGPTGSFTVNSTLTKYSAQIALGAAAANGVLIRLSVGAQTSGTWDITELQLEAGSTASSFETRPIGTELALCQRYYQTSYTSNPVPTNTAAGYLAVPSANVANGASYGFVQFLTQMRIAPTVTVYSYASSVTNKVSDLTGSDLAASSGNVATTAPTHFWLNNNSGGAITAANGGFAFQYAATAEIS